MRLLQLDIPHSQEPAYKRIAEALRGALRAGRLRRGELLPSTRELGSQVHVHRHTVTRALEELVAEGWIEAEPGRGYRVVAPPALEEVSQAVWPPFAAVPQLSPRQESEYSFPSGKPDLRLFPSTEFFRHLRGLLRDLSAESLLGYSDPAGSLAFRQQIKSYLARMRGISKGEVVVTHGSQEAIFLLGQLFAKGERKTIAVEALGYRPAWDALGLTGARLVGLPVDDEGLQVDALENLAKEEPPALLYITPLHQYPTTATLSLERRRQLLSVIAKYRIPVIEDDYDHEFHYTGKPSLPLAGEDESGLVIYVSTFSKLVYPSARLGFCIVGKEVLGPLCRLKRCVTRQNDLLLQETMAAWMESGGLDRHLRRMRRIYGQRLECMAAGLREIGLRFRMPQGGMSIWVDLEMDSERLVAESRRLGLPLRPGRDYALEEQSPVEHLRLGFASSEPEEIQDGLSLLAEAWNNLRC